MKENEHAVAPIPPQPPAPSLLDTVEDPVPSPQREIHPAPPGPPRSPPIRSRYSQGLSPAGYGERTSPLPEDRPLPVSRAKGKVLI